jgi:mannose-6-phosphate isomerase-like protein (cupin superfamily)
MFVRMLLIAVAAVLLTSGNGWSQSRGYVLKPGEGEMLGPDRLIKASPRTGTQGGVMVLDHAYAGFSTGPDYHRHENADEFFYIISGTGTSVIDDEEYEIGPGDVIFIPHGVNHIMSVSEDGPMELLFFFDRPGADDWFRRAHEQYFSQGIPFTLEDCNELGADLGYVCQERN